MRLRPDLLDAESPADFPKVGDWTAIADYPEEKKEALEHLDFAIKEFTEMKMQPSLEKALRQKKILKA